MGGLVKITQFDPDYSRNLGSGDTFLVSGPSGGSNSGFGGDVVGSWGELSVIGLRSAVSLSSNLTGAIGDVLTIISTSPLVAQFATGSNAASSTTVSIAAFFDGGGSTIAANATAVDIYLPFNVTLTAATTLADQTTNTVLSVWSDTYANYPPTIADNIAAAASPTISAASKAQDNTLTGWTTSLASGRTIRVAVASNSAAQRVSLHLTATRS